MGTGISTRRQGVCQEKVGVKLPATKTEGREDAADACGAWKCGVRMFARRHLQALDARIYGSRGAML